MLVFAVGRILVLGLDFTKFAMSNEHYSMVSLGPGLPSLPSAMYSNSSLTCTHLEGTLSVLFHLILNCSGFILNIVM